MKLLGIPIRLDEDMPRDAIDFVDHLGRRKRWNWQTGEWVIVEPVEAPRVQASDEGTHERSE